MVVNEKGLCRAMNEAAGQEGYKLLMTGNELDIMGDNWAVWFCADDVPRKILALLVEHTGCIPQGECLNITKRKGDFKAENYMGDVFADELNGRMRFTEEAVAKNTGVTCWGMSVWASELGDLLTVEPGLFELRDTMDRPVVTGSGSLLWSNMTTGEGLCLFAGGRERVVVSEKDAEIWKALMAIDWWRYEDLPHSAADSDGEQMELEGGEEE